MVKISYLSPSARTFEFTLAGWLMRELPGATHFKFATAYFDARVLDWLEDPIRQLVESGGTVQALVGSNSGGTSVADLTRLFDLFGGAGSGTLHVEYAEGGIFHPKVFLVESAQRAAAVVGSANLTAAASLVNVEAGVLIETDEVGPPVEPPLEEIAASIDPTSRLDAFEIGSLDDLVDLERMGIIGREVRVAPSQLNQGQATNQRERRRSFGVRTRPPIQGAPSLGNRSSARHGRSTGGATAPQPAAGAGDYFGVRFAPNDLKSTGTREFSVSRSIRDWVEQVLGRPIRPGEGRLLTLPLEGRLAAAPTSIYSTTEPVRIWAAGGSGGTHTDVRMVLGNTIRSGLEDQAIRLTGLPVPGGSIGVFELPSVPAGNSARLTVFLPSDATFGAIERLLQTGRGERKPHFRVAALPQVPRWP